MWRYCSTDVACGSKPMLHVHPICQLSQRFWGASTGSACMSASLGACDPYWEASQWHDTGGSR